MQKFYKKTRKDSLGFTAITGTLFPNIRSFKEKHNITYPFYLGDDIALKTVIRSNPGLLLLEDGIIRDKWHYNDFPDYGEFKKNYINHDKKST